MISKNRRKFCKLVLAGIIVPPLTSCSSDDQKLSENQIRNLLNATDFDGIALLNRLRDNSEKELVFPDVINLLKMHQDILKIESGELLITHVQTLIKSDYIKNNTVPVKGFIFSKTEISLYQYLYSEQIKIK